MASVVVTYLQGLWRVALVDYDRLGLEQQIDAFLTGLGLDTSVGRSATGRPLRPRFPTSI